MKNKPDNKSTNTFLQKFIVIAHKGPTRRANFLLVFMVKKIITRKYTFGDTILQRSFFTVFISHSLRAFFYFIKKSFIMVPKNNRGHRNWMTNFESQHQYFSIFSIKISVCPFPFIVI